MKTEVEKSYLDRLLEDEKYNLTFSIEEALVEAGERLIIAMEESELTKSKIADKLGLSLPLISRAMNGSHNLTIRTMVSILWACNKRLVLGFEDMQKEDAESNHKFAVQITASKPARPVKKRPFNVRTNMQTGHHERYADVA